MANGMATALGIGKKSEAPQAPGSLRDKFLGGNSQSSGGGLTGGSATIGLPQADGASGEGKVSQDDAGYIPAGQICGGCVNYTKETGDCAKVEGQFQAHDSCKTMYQAANSTQDQPEEAAAKLGTGGADAKAGVVLGV